MTSRSPSIVPILAVNFIGTLGYSIVLPFLVFLVVRLGGNAIVYGIIGATYSAFQMVGAPLLGRWSDRVGRKKVLIVSQVGTFVSWGVFLWALSLPVDSLIEVDTSALGAFTLTLPLVVLFLARSVDGLTGGNISVANAYLADITTEEDRSANFGRLAVATNVGFVLGPALAGVLGATGAGERLPVLAALVISGVGVIVIWSTLDDPEACVLTENPDPSSVRDMLGGDQRDCYRVQTGPPLSFRRVLALPSVGLLLFLQLLIFVAFNLFYVAFPVYAATALEWTLIEVGVYFAVTGLLMAVVQGPVLKRLTKVVSDRALVIGGSAILAAGFAFFASTSSVVIYAGTALVALGNGVMWPSLLSTLSKSTLSSVQGSVQGVSGSVTASASIAGLLIGGAFYQWMGSGVFLVSAGITALAAVAALRAGPRSVPTVELA